MNCEQVLDLLPTDIDSELPDAERSALRDHLDDCSTCRATADALRQQDAELRRGFAVRRRAAAGVAERVVAELSTSSRKDSRMNKPTNDDALRRLRWRLGWLMAAAVAGIGFGLHYLHRPAAPTDGAAPSVATAAPKTPDGEPGLTARPRGPAPTLQPLAVNGTVQTGANERKRLALPDGSVLYVNQNTRVRMEDDRTLRLLAGEVFVEVAPQDTRSGQRFTVRTDKRTVTATGTRFSVNAKDGRAGVLVTQGHVHVSDVGSLSAGDQVTPQGSQATRAERASHLLDWTRELMAAAESPLVPDSKYSGGALVAVDPYGQEAKLGLRKYHVDVHIEDGFARTIIDQTYFNHNAWRMEGTFYFPLPPDASLSRLAMYVGPDLMEGGMAERDYARNVYEQIVTSQRDPALLEWLDGSTFKMRVFPLEGRQEKRIIIGYTQRLSSLYGRSQYRFPGGHNLGVVDQWSFAARIKNAEGTTVHCDSHNLKDKAEGADILLSAKEEGVKLDKDVVLELQGRDKGTDTARFTGMSDDGYRYLMLRYRPQMLVQKKRESRDWVFLFESSGDRDPLLARVQIDVIRTLLANAEHNDTFAILSAGTRVQSFPEKPMLVTPENVQAAIKFLEGRHLVGALDLENALTSAAPLLKAGPNAHLVHVGTGVPALGERRIAELAARLPSGSRYVGVGVGKRWNRDFMKTAAERTGGYFTQINPDEAVSWRAFELAATLNTPRLMNVSISGGQAHFLTFGSAVAQGEEIAAVARVPLKEPLPARVTIRGYLDGQPVEQDFPVPPAIADAGHLPRTWAKLEIERQLAEPQTDERRKEIVDLSKAMYVMTPYTSLLVLESEKMYEDFKVDRGRKDHWAPYVTPAKIAVVFEPLPGQGDTRFAPKMERPHANQVRDTIAVRSEPQQLRDAMRPAEPWVVEQWSERSGNEKLRVFEEWQYERSKAAFQEEVTTFPSAKRVTYTIRTPSGAIETRSKWVPYTVTKGPATVGQIVIVGNTVTRENVIRRQNRVYPGQVLPYPELTETYLYLENILEAPRKSREVNHGIRYVPAYKYSGPGKADPTGGRRFGPPVLSKIPIPRTYLEGEETRTGSLMFDDRVELSARRKNVEELKKSVDLGFITRPMSNVERRLDRSRGGPDAQRAQREVLARLDELIAEMEAPGPFLYRRPSFSNRNDLFVDLVSYAPGLNTSDADIAAVIEAEAAPTLDSLPGRIDPEARELIESARKGGWRTLTIGSGDDTILVTFDGAGRFAYERTLPLGLSERVVCDGSTLLHIYPELGLASRRSVSRFHRAELAALLPWLLPPAEDLAHGADLRRIDARTVAVVPHGAESARDEAGKPLPYHTLHLVIADGRLIEHRLVEMPSNKVQLRVTYDTNGDIRWFDADGKELTKSERKLGEAKAPELKPDLNKLVVLPLPYRSAPHVYKRHGVDRGLLLGDFSWIGQFLDEEAATDLFAAEFATGHGGNAGQVYTASLGARGIRKPGHFVLLAATGVAVGRDADFARLLEEKPRDPLLNYLAFATNDYYSRAQKSWGLNLGDTVGADGSFLHRLAAFRDLTLRWNEGDATLGTDARRRAEQERAFAFIRRNKDNFLGLTMLTFVQQHADDAAVHRAVAELWKLFDRPGLAYVARYEQARETLAAGDTKNAADLFRKLYHAALKEDVLPPIDDAFYRALRQTDGEGWDTLIRATATGLLKDGDRRAVVTMAWQCRQLGDEALSDNLLAAALRDPANDVDRLLVTLAAVDYLTQTSQVATADALLQPLLVHPQFSRSPYLWRLAAMVANQNDQSGPAVYCLEKALELEFQDLPPVINLQQVRNEYGMLLAHYELLARASASMKIDPPADLLPRLIRSADRWRALDRDSSIPCERTATILKLLGARDLAWDYLTTPISQRPNEAAPWRTLAQTLAQSGERDLADRAYQAAFAAEPTDAQLLWDRAQNLQRAGKGAAAQVVLRQIVDGKDWQPRFRGLQTQARWLLEAR